MFAVALPFLGGCGKAIRHENRQDNRPVDYVREQAYEGVSIRIEKLSEKEKRLYLKRRRNAVVPVRVTFDNASSKDYQFNPHDINLPLADSKTIIRSLTSSGKAAYSSFASLPLFGSVFGGLIGVLCAGSPMGEPIGGAVGAVYMCIGGIVGLATGVIAGTILTCLYARNKHKKNKQIIAQEEQKYMKMISIPAGQKTSVVLYLKKNAVLPENIELTLRSGETKESMPMTLAPVAII